MFRKLRERFGINLAPERRSSPSPALSDDLLADEEGYREEDIEACLRSMCARREALPGTNQTSALLSLGAAEQFASECLEYGDQSTHRANASHIAMAIQSWAAGRGRAIPEIPAFLAALLVLLEHRGGFVAKRPNGSAKIFAGCRLNEQAITMLNVRAGHIQDGKRPNLKRIIGELLG